MKKIGGIIAFLVALLLPLAVQATQLSGPQALRRANLAKKSGLKSASALQLVKVVTDGAGHNLYYVYRNAYTGRVYFLSADDCGRPLLGYTDQAVDVADSFPQPLNEMLDFYGKEIAYGIAHPDSVKPFGLSCGKTSRLKSFETDFPSIPVLLPYEWGTKPFNSQCPMIDSTRTLCGCVALAMFQVMNYWQYPAAGRDTVMYATTLGGKDTVLSLDLNGSVYNWAALADLTSEEGIAAAGVLGRDCAYSVHATFGLSSTSAKTSTMTKALVRYFDYDSSMACVARYDDEERWFRILYNELENGRPVVYAANGSYGHAFVCDGFNAADTTFHFNWSWYGKYNGYYAFTALNPGNDQFNEMNMMVIGIQPPKTFVRGSKHVFAYGDLVLDPFLDSRSDCHTVCSLGPTTTKSGFASKGIFFAPPIYPTTQVALQMVNEATSDTLMLAANYGNMLKSSDAVYDNALYIAHQCIALDNTYKFLSSNTTYTVRLFYRDFTDDDWMEVSYPDGAAKSAKFHLCDNGMLVDADDSHVSPLLHTDWKQDWINFYCPRYYGNYCSAGYDATAIGQICYALRAPAKVFGTISYDTFKVSTPYTFTFDEDYITPDVPYFGKAIRTNYNLHSTIHSPAAMVYGLRNNMGLANCQFASRKFYTTEQWISMLDEQLAKGCPVYYCGYKIQGADSVRRAFVVDGYNEIHSYHVNFGEGGEGDKYTDINVINYTGTTPGNTDWCFPNGQGMLVDFFTDCTIDSVNLPTHPFMLMSPLVVNGDSSLTSLSLASGETATLKFHLADCTTFESFYDSTASYMVGVGVYSGESLRKVAGSATLPVLQLSGSLSFSLPTLNGSSYELALVTSVDGGTTWERVYNNAPNSIPFSLKRGQATLSIPFNPSFGADLALFDAMEVVNDSVKGLMAHLPLANYTQSNYEDVLRVVVKTSATDSVIYDAQVVAVYGTTTVNYDIVLPSELTVALANGGQLLGYYYKVGEGWLPLQQQSAIPSVSNETFSQGPISIYAPNGACLKVFDTYSSAVDAFIKSQVKGVYLVKQGAKTHKVVND